MSRNMVVIDAPTEQVFAVLTDARAYGSWVVGAKRVRSVDGTWPQPGSRFHHTVGAGPAVLEDSSKVLGLEENRHLTLEVRFRPLGVGIVDFELDPVRRDGATLLTMDERPKSGPVRSVWGTVLDRVMAARNALALRRLRTVVERRAAAAAPRSEE